MPRKHKVPGRDATELEKWRYEYSKRKSSQRTSLVPGANQIEYRKKVNYFAFLTMVVAACRKDSLFNPTKVLNDWWRFAFVKPFPQDGACIEELTERIRTKLWEDCHDEPVPDDPIMLQDKDYQESLYCQINKLNPEEVSVTTKTKTKTKTKATKTKQPAKGKGKTARKEPKERSLDKSGQSRLMCVDLLMEKKYTDEEIVQKITDELDYPYSVKRVDRIRQGINEGKREKKGIPAPNPPLEPITKGSSSESTPAKVKTKTKARRTKTKK
jgi:hypothetical protein